MGCIGIRVRVRDSVRFLVGREGGGKEARERY